MSSAVGPVQQTPSRRESPDESPGESPGEKIAIEPANWRDLNAVRHLEQICFPKDAWPVWDLVGVLTFPNVVRLKAMNGDKLVGFIAADVRGPEGLAWIATIGVLPEYRQRGIGSSLLRACEDQLKVKAVRLSVRASNQPAITLYERSGYRQVGQWTRYYNDGEDGVVMEKEL